MEEGNNKVQMADKVDYTKIPLRALNVPCRKKLSISLHPELLFPTQTEQTRYWQRLCELAGFDYDFNQLLKNKSDPVDTMLEHLVMKQFTIANLINMLTMMERFDVIEDIQPLLENDANDFVENQRNNKPNLLNFQRDKINSIALSKVPRLSKSSFIPSKCDQSCATYDAYVAYSKSDVDFVVELVEKLEKMYNLRLFIKDRDMLPGVVEIEEDLHLINERCKKILIVVSQESLSDPYCEFQAILAQTTAVDCSLYARKVIPIICKPCVFPARLKHLAKLDYTKPDFFAKFWDRLYYSITGEIYNPFPAASTSSKNPS